MKMTTKRGLIKFQQEKSHQEPNNQLNGKNELIKKKID